MKRYNEVDMAFYADGVEGDVILGKPDADGLVDFALTGPYDCARQDIINRVRTQRGDWRHHNQIGGDLELLEGEPNTRETAAKGVTQIYDTLMADGRFLQADLYIRPVPISIEQIDFYMLLDAGEEKPLAIKQSLDL
ncbi:hypothetical protein GZH47_32655 (plasmid) [Paenibacillus rhizovicinus]|uniref:Uncharacterized protein n=1 Tax=Paenibacillus rhizovicinus TaxID=2704463 RepID=A0A6C0PB98_9BACL|nr:hypothetical protein [Paenibacillus rhizovicinus]QHW35651.1 hypothetical protein GZH47_32655 [Paenibacillus rhizovicinus]